MPSFILQLIDQLSTSLALQIFSASTSILILALIGLVWARAVRWSYLDTMPLNRVEFDHPHLPSAKNVAFQIAAFLCVTSAVLIAERALWDMPYRIVEQLGPILLITTIGIAAELHSPRARMYGLSLNLGTAIGLGITSLLSIGTVSGAISSMLLCGATALLLVTQVQNRTFVRRWPLNAHILFVASAGIWMLYRLS